MALFGRSTPREDEAEKSRQSQAPSAPAASSLFHKEAPRSEVRNAVIGPHVRIQGELSGDEDIVVEGRVEGKISVTKSLRVGPQAQVNAEVRAQNVVIAGRIVGNVTAMERVELLPSGSLEGNIRSPKIVIAEGAQFKGSVDMTAPKAGAGASDGEKEKAAPIQVPPPRPK